MPGGTFMIEIFAFVILALGLASRTPEDSVGTAMISVIALTGIALLGVLQLLPMSIDTLRGLSPMSSRVYEEANAVLRLFNRANVAPRISIAPNETKDTILLTLSYAALFTAGAILLNTRNRRRWIVLALFATASIHVLVSTTMVGASERLHGAFVNPNHFAGYLEIALAFAFGLIWAEVLTGRDRASGIRDRGERLEKRLLPFVWRVLLWGVIAAGIALTRSRGAVLAAMLTTVVLLAMALTRRRGERAAIIAVAIALGIGFVAFTTGEASLLRFLGSDPRDVNTDTRVVMWRSSIDAWRLFPNFGAGLGAFKEAYRRVQPSEVAGLIEQAHNDFLQLLVTGGWIGALLGVTAFGAMFVVLFRGWVSQQHREESAFILAGVGALLSLTLHGIVEFNMSLPAIPATLAVMLGASTTAVRHHAS